jgi:hypothetical protein
MMMVVMLRTKLAIRYSIVNTRGRRKDEEKRKISTAFWMPTGCAIGAAIHHHQ